VRSAQRRNPGVKAADKKLDLWFEQQVVTPARDAWGQGWGLLGEDV
jgi:hypothetical protein